MTADDEVVTEVAVKVEVLVGGWTLYYQSEISKNFQRILLKALRYFENEIITRTDKIQ